MNYMEQRLLIFLGFSKLLDHINDKHPKATFSAEQEYEKLIFRHCSVSKWANNFVRRGYRSPTFSGLGISYLSYGDFCFKVNVFKTLLLRFLMSPCTFFSYPRLSSEAL